MPHNITINLMHIYENKFKRLLIWSKIMNFIKGACVYVVYRVIFEVRIGENF